MFGRIPKFDRTGGHQQHEKVVVMALSLTASYLAQVMCCATQKMQYHTSSIASSMQAGSVAASRCHPPAIAKAVKRWSNNRPDIPF
jgi:hypothetical protein